MDWDEWLKRRNEYAERCINDHLSADDDWEEIEEDEEEEDECEEDQ